MSTYTSYAYTYGANAGVSASAVSGGVVSAPVVGSATAAGWTYGVMLYISASASAFAGGGGGAGGGDGGGLGIGGGLGAMKPVESVRFVPGGHAPSATPYTNNAADADAPVA